MDITRDKDSEEILAQAEEWFARMRSDCVSESDRSRFQEWLDSHPQNAAAYEQVGRLWLDINQTRTVREYKRSRKQPSWFQRAMPYAAALVLVVAGAAFVFFYKTSENFSAGVASPKGLHQEFSAKLGQMKRLSLEDGSTVELNGDSLLRVHFSKERREVTLLRGHAYFVVVHNSQRPFVVESANGKTTVLGTEFDVRMDKEVVTVTNAQGRVRVESSNAVELSANQQTSYGPSGLVPGLTKVDASAITAWRQGELVFTATPLRDVVAELRRYHDLEFTIDDSLLDTLRLTARLKINDIEGFTANLESVFPVKVRRISNTQIIISKRL